MRTRVKYCGMTRPQDAEYAANIGVDAIGLVFYAPSPRSVNIAQAQQIVAQLPPFVSVVGLFVDADKQDVLDCMQQVRLDILQFHGDEAAAYCEQFDRPYLKAIRMREGTDLSQISRQYASASGILVDSYQPNIPGGTGKTFDWSMLKEIDKPLILAGGLVAENVAQAIKEVRPYAVDVSGGIEEAKGIKSNQKMSAFMREVING